MDALRDVYRSLGFASPRTYIQSGNVVFETADGRDPVDLASRIEDALGSNLGFRPSVICRTAWEWRQIVERNPFAARTDIDAAKLAVTFLAAELAADVRAQVLELRVEPEELHCLHRELYVYFPNGFSRSQLSMPRLERTLKVACTSRNWNTVMRLQAMADA